MADDRRIPFVPAPANQDGLYDAKGRWVPRHLIRDVDLARHELVLELASKAQRLQAMMIDFKRTTLEDIEAFIQLSAEKYGTKVGGDKGNITLMTYDGRFKVQRAMDDHLVFDERLQVAKQLVDECIREWSEGSRGEIRALVEHAFQVDKTGRVSTERVLGLRRLAIEDERWRKAMDAIGDSVHVVRSTAYVRFYERVGDTNQWRPISLDLATVPAEEVHHGVG
jgi:hypothetical protein